MITFRPFNAHGSLSRRIYAAFLMAAVVPTAMAGLIGIYLSLQALKAETLRNLNQEVSVRAQGIDRFFSQLSSQLLYLANSRGLVDVTRASQSSNAWLLNAATSRLERDYAALISLYPHIYQLRLISADGQERIRVDRTDRGVLVVPQAQLQNKGDRYYFKEALSIRPGEIYTSPLDLNVEFGQVEKPERPVIRFATPVAGVDGETVAVLIINLHAEVLLNQIQEMANARQGTAYLLDNQGQFLSRSVGGEVLTFSMEPIARLGDFLPASIVKNLVEAGTSLTASEGWIVAHTTIDYSPQVVGSESRQRWRIALAFPESSLFFTIANLYFLYAVLSVALLVTAVGGYLISRRLLRPLDDLSMETDAISGGDFSRRVSVTGTDEIAALGNKFNTMAHHLQRSSTAITAHRKLLEDEVVARTRDLEQERASLEAVIEHTADGIFSIDLEGGIRLINPAAIRLLGPGAGVLGERIDSFWPQWPEFARNAVLKPLRCDMDSNERVLSLAVTPTPAGYVVVARDVSWERSIQDERRELDRQMSQMEKLTTLGELAMGMAHEIGNPLAGMKAVAQAMQYEENTPTPTIQALQRLESEIDRLTGFLRSFHGFAVPPSISSVACDFNFVVDDLLFWTRKDAISQHIKFELIDLDTVPALLADPHQLKQVFLNLIMNAIHAMPQGGTLTMVASFDAAFARIDVHDTGLGIEPAILEKIFNPFFTTRPEGTGLGLAIVTKIITQHGGRIEAQSTVGHGACFSVTWPLAGAAHV